MKNVSALENIHKHGLFGNHDSKDELINIREIKDVLIYQIVKYKKSSISVDKIKIDNLNLPETLLVSSNKNTRILWMGPDNWLVVSKNKEIEKSILENLSHDDFALTDLSHSRTILELEGSLVDEVLKKGCPLNLDGLDEGKCSNSAFHAITITIDFISSNPRKVRIFALRSFGESLYHSITDACLEFGYKAE